MFIPGILISMVTFPGVIVHEFAHLVFCKLRGVNVLDVCYFQVDGDAAGYVIHESTDNFTDTFLIAMGPFFVNTVLCLLICFPAYMPISYFDIQHPLSYLLMWLGVSIGMHAIPSNVDANNVFQQAKREIKTMNPLAIISMPLVGLIYVFNFLRFFWIDFFYAIGVGVGLPSLLYGV